MKYSLILLVAILFASYSNAQPSDTNVFGNVTVEKDNRIDVLASKMGEYNQSLSLRKARTGPGYRLMLLSTNNRNEALKLRTALIQQYPEHKVYMVFKSPFLKIKFGDFVEKKDAEDMRKQLLKSGLITGNIYLVSETIEIKPEKIEEE
ncbi:MAG: SPOR domain-containing protein [Bacteroidetes bacterium]|nr:SPOR domain-containing protein [Bacteroidota bacterium]